MEKWILLLGICCSLNAANAQDKTNFNKAVHERMKTLGLHEKIVDIQNGSQSQNHEVTRFDDRGRTIETTSTIMDGIVRRTYMYDDQDREIRCFSYALFDTAKVASERRTSYPDSLTRVEDTYNENNVLEERKEEITEYVTDTITITETTWDQNGLQQEKSAIKVITKSDSLLIYAYISYNKNGFMDDVQMTYTLIKKDDKGNTIRQSGSYIPVDDENIRETFTKDLIETGNYELTMEKYLKRALHGGIKFAYDDQMKTTEVFNTENQLVLSMQQGIFTYKYTYDSKGNLSKMEMHNHLSSGDIPDRMRVVEVSYAENGLPTKWMEYDTQNPSAKDISTYTFH